VNLFGFQVVTSGQRLNPKSLAAYRLALTCIVMGVVLLAGARRVRCQEALRTSLAGEDAARARRNALENPSANVQMGLASFMVGASFGLEWNDNVSYSDENKQADLILHPGFSLATSIPMTEQNGFFATVDIGYAKYIKYSQYDHLFIGPGSQLAFDAYAGDFHFDFHDYLAVTEQPVAQGTISGSGNYGLLSNLAGLGVDWDLNQLIASFNYDHQTVLATTSAYSYLDHSGDIFVLRASFESSSSWSWGPEASAGTANYDQPVLNDSKNYSLGGFVTWKPTTLFNTSLRGGYTSFSFEALPHQNPIPDTSNYYLDLNVAHRINEWMTFSLSAGRQTRLGVNSELIDFWYAHPVIAWGIFEKFRFDTHLTFESGSDTGNPVYVVNEDYTLLGGGIGASYPLLEKMLLTLNYDYAVKNSSEAVRDYHQHRVLLQIQYAF
jgi:hypothetical protein